MSTYCSVPVPHDLVRQTRLDRQHDLTVQPDSAAMEPTGGNGEDAFRAILLGESLVVRRLRAQVERIAPYFRKALVRGESGSGKRLVAQALHAMSRCDGAFVVCKARSLAQTLAEDFSAPEITALLDSARGGTLYLEEISDVPYALQSGLLRIFAEPTAGKSGGMRIIAATCRDLRTMASVGQFRQDLYAELSVIELSAPSLSQRAEDLPILADWILARVSRRTGFCAKVLSASATAELLTRGWMNNLRGLEQVVTHAAALADGHVIEPGHLAPSAEAPAAAALEPPARARSERLQDVIHEHVVDVLTRCAGNKLRAAEMLGISRSTLYRMLEAGPGAAGMM